MSFVLGLSSLFGRILLGMFFFSQSVQRIDEWQASIAVVRAKNLPFGEVLLALSLIAMLFGSMGLVSDFQTRFSALALAVCTVAWIMLAHDFWMFQDSEQWAFHYQAFALGAAIMGGLFCLAGTGGGRIAIDAIIREQ